MAKASSSFQRPASEANPTPTGLQPLDAGDGEWVQRYREVLEVNGRLRQMVSAREETLAQCAHDLRNPLSSLSHHAQMLDSGSRGALPPAAQVSVQAMLRAGASMKALIDRLLDLRALETGAMEMERESTDLALVILDLVAELNSAAAEKALRVEVDGLDRNQLIADVDCLRIRQALGNLLSNAVKFSPHGGAIRISASRVRQGWQLVVEDHGPGIPSGEQQDLFKRYRRGRIGRRQGQGAGLGLAFASEVLLAHGGSLSCSSAPGQGTRFTAWIPPHRSAEGAEHPHLRKTVLVVEDDLDAREGTVDLLDERFEVIQCRDGEEAVQAARQFRPHAILMDLFMPRMDGITALQDLRLDPRTAEIPVLFLSGHSDEAAKVQALDLGAADYLVKPLSGRELLARVDRVIRVSEQRTALKAMAQLDSLTGIPNYGGFTDRLEDEMHRASRYHTPISAVMIDLDHLKSINDSCGHDVGNRAIVALADHIRSELRTSDFAARFGGDEFVVLLPHTAVEEARCFAERVRVGLLQLRLTTGDGELAICASFGVAGLVPTPATRVEELCGPADEALYRAKRGGGNRVCAAPPQAVAVEPRAHP